MKAVLLLAALATQCNLETKPKPPAPAPAPAPAPDPSTPSCSSACARLIALGCHNGNPTAEGATCVEVCRNAAEGGLPLPVACVSRSSSCEEAASCEVP